MVRVHATNAVDHGSVQILPEDLYCMSHPPTLCLVWSIHCQIKVSMPQKTLNQWFSNHSGHWHLTKGRFYFFFQILSDIWVVNSFPSEVLKMLSFEWMLKYCKASLYCFCCFPCFKICYCAVYLHLAASELSLGVVFMGRLLRCQPQAKVCSTWLCNSNVMLNNSVDNNASSVQCLFYMFLLGTKLFSLNKK